MVGKDPWAAHREVLVLLLRPDVCDRQALHPAGCGEEGNLDDHDDDNDDNFDSFAVVGRVVVGGRRRVLSLLSQCASSIDNRFYA